MSSQAAIKYAKALYDVTKDHEKVLNELRGVEKILSQDAAVKSFIESEVISDSIKKEAITKAFTDKGLSQEVLQALVVMAGNGRLYAVSDLVREFQDMADKEHGVVRGEIRSAAKLDPEAKKRIEGVVAKVTNKKVILSYVEDSKLVGGIVAKVGGWTFEDTLDSHIRRLREELNRRAN